MHTGTVWVVGIDKDSPRFFIVQYFTRLLFNKKTINVQGEFLLMLEFAEAKGAQIMRVLI